MEINDKTKIPLFAALTTLPFVIGGILWLASIDSKASGAQGDVRDLKTMVSEIRERVIRIEQFEKDHQ